MSVNPYLSPVPDAPLKVSAYGRAVALACMLLAAYCGLFFAGSAVAALVTTGPLDLSAAALAASGVGAWGLVGWAFCRGCRVTASIAGALGVVAVVLLTV